MCVKPIIVSGIGRSGTSAVLSSFNTHKSIIEIPRIGEAPFITAFLDFLIEFEDKSPAADYNRKNYRLSEESRREAISEFLMLMQCGIPSDSVNDSENKYWITKTSLVQESFEKACELYGEIRCVYIMRNGIEVINSARKFVGFKDLSFKQQCKRWLQNLEECQYLQERPLCCTIKHDELVKEPDQVYRSIFQALDIPHDDAPSKWISENLFNSSFDSTSKLASTNNVFDNRLSNAWSDWSDEEKDEFITLCDSTMCEYNFSRPYVSTDSTDKNKVIPAVELKSVQAAKKIKIVDSQSYSEDILGLCEGKMNKEIANYICNISTKYNYLYVNNAKVASTSILKMLQHCEDSDAAELMSTPHDRPNSPLVKLTSLDHREQHRYLFGEDVKRFTFVRNPFSRILSAYLSKIARPLSGYKYDSNRPNVVPPKAEIISLYTGKDISESTDFSIEIDFQTFVEIICEQDSFDMDPHWKPQFDLLMADKIEYSYIGRFENISKDITELMSHINISNYKAAGYSKNRTDSQSQLEKFYTSDIVQLVADKYQIDFERYGYSWDIDLLLPTSA